MNQRSEAGRYEGQNYPCHGVASRLIGLHTFFQPWYFDGRIVWYGQFCNLYSEAMEAARAL